MLTRIAHGSLALTMVSLAVTSEWTRLVGLMLVAISIATFLALVARVS